MSQLAENTERKIKERRFCNVSKDRLRDRANMLIKKTIFSIIFLNGID